MYQAVHTRRVPSIIWKLYLKRVDLEKRSLVADRSGCELRAPFIGEHLADSLGLGLPLWRMGTLRVGGNEMRRFTENAEHGVWGAWRKPSVTVAFP